MGPVDPPPPANGPVSDLQEAIHNLLNPRELGEFREIVDDYQTRKNLVDFCHALSILLDTPAKRTVSRLLKQVIPRSHVAQYDQLMSEHFRKSHSAALWESSTLPRRPNKAAPPVNYGTLPNRRIAAQPSTPAKVIRKPMAHTDFLGTGRSSMPDWEPRRPQQTKRIHMLAPDDPTQGLGFSIRGGAEHGIGIYVSYVDVGSTAERQGLAPGDLILGVNGVSFRKITHDEAARIVKTSRRLDLDVRNVGRVPGSFETHQTYTWVDADGRPVTPPPEVDRAGRYETNGTRKSGLMLLKGSDESKVNLVVGEGQILGISIRGGNEFGLGLYVTQVDRGSVTANAGLKVGDQLLDVNGYSFLDISHVDAVRVLKSSRHLMITVKDVGKLPYARTTHDHTQWITGPRLRNATTHSLPGDVGGRSDTHSIIGGFTMDHRNDSMFSRGAGSQLMHNSMMHQTTPQMAVIDETARVLLSDRERATLKYYLDEYHRGYITADALCMALYEVLNNRKKFALVSDIRGVISPKDIKTFDHLMMQREVTMLKSKSMDNLLLLSDRHDNPDSNGYYGSPSHSGQHHTASEEEMDALRHAIKLLETDRQRDAATAATRKPQTSRTKSKIKAAIGSLRRKKKPVPSPDQTKITDPVDNLKGKEEMRSPSEDSGVDLNGASQTTDTSSTHQRAYNGNWQQLSSSPGAAGRIAPSAGPEPDTVVSYGGHRYRVTGPSAYSLLDTPESAGDDLSEFDESLHRRMDMFKTLPAQFEMVHANIQTEDDWARYNGRSSRADSARSHSLDRHKLRHRTQLSPRQQDIILTSPGGPWVEDATDRPPKPPRTQSSRSQRPEEFDMTPAVYESALHIPDIYVDRPGSSPWDEPLTIVPPPPPSSHSIYDDLALDGMVAPPPPPSNHGDHPIAIVPPPPPMDSPLQLSPDAGHRKQSTPSSSPKKQARPPEVQPLTLKHIRLSKSRPNLGIAIEGGANTRQPLPRIINIQPGGAASLSNELKVGDIIVKVNHQPLEGLQHRECAKTIAQAFKDKSSDVFELWIKDETKKMAL